MRVASLISFLLIASWCSAQDLSLQKMNLKDFNVVSFRAGPKVWPTNIPIVEFTVNGKVYDLTERTPLTLAVIEWTEDDVKGRKYIVNFTNNTSDTLTLSNVVPMGAKDKEAVITGLGDHYLSRTHLFLPGRTPVNVIVPDNAWNLGYSATRLDGDYSVFGLARRDPESFRKATRRRFETIILPGGSVNYDLYFDLYKGSWQNGLREVFQHRYLYDLKSFDDELYQRKDLQWIKEAYVMHLMMAWDKDYFDYKTGEFNWAAFEEKGRRLYGGDDVVCLWPTWPSLGLDQRNQFDLYRDLPGGLEKLRELADTLRSHGTKFFVAYNPWDESTRLEGHLQGLASLIEGTSADGVVLDTKGESSKELQEAADKVRPGVIMYSEGMAVTKDMPGIISGRVHNALYYPPMLNLNKLIRPDFAIFRVAEVFKEPIRREYAVSFFNGYGTEINQFAPGHPDYEDEQYLFFGRTSRILRENSTNFNGSDWIPIIPTLRDSIWVNQWPGKDKTIYTIYNRIPSGFKAPLFEVQTAPDRHFVSLWNHTELEPIKIGDKYYVEADAESFHRKYLGTNNEGSIDCIAELPVLISSHLEGNTLSVKAAVGNEFRIWGGDPSYEKSSVKRPVGEHTIDVAETFGRYEGKIVVQLFRDNELLDEVVENIRPGTPRLISAVEKTVVTKSRPENMSRIPAGNFTFTSTNGDEFIPYPKVNNGKTFKMSSYWMDKYPVTNAEFKRFLHAAKYEPSDKANFLKHWTGGQIPKGQENFPVVYVSYEDAKAYAKWAGKRLPTELEWQYAAQTEKLNEWPWKQKQPVTRKNQEVTATLTVSNIEGIDPAMCNLGDGELYNVGKYKKGVNPNGLYDLTGCVWQLTNDEYESGSYRYVLMKGGSYFKPSSSWWYVQGGPRELHYRQFLLRVSQGFERNATVGFRCVKD